MMEEMINEVVKEYFRGGNWQAKLKELVREMKKNENNSNGSKWYKVRHIIVEWVEGEKKESEVEYDG